MHGFLDDLHLFTVVATSGSLTRASQQLGTPKATISRRLTQLEGRVATRLLNRSTRHVALTQEGQMVLERSTRLMADAEEVLTVVSHLSSNTQGVLRVTMPPGFGTLILHEVIASFVEAHPEIILDIDETGKHRDLIKDRIDIAFRAGKLQDSSLISRALPPVLSGFYMSPSLSVRAGKITSPQELQRFKFIRAGQHLTTQTLQVNDGNESVRLALAPAVCVTSTATAVALAVAGAGFIYAPLRSCAVFVKRGELTRVLPKWGGKFSELRMVTPYRTLLPRKTQLFIEHVLHAHRQ